MSEYSIELKRRMHFHLPIIKERSYIGARSINYNFGQLYRLFPNDSGVAFLLARFYVKNSSSSLEEYYNSITSKYGCVNTVSIKDIKKALSS